MVQCNRTRPLRDQIFLAGCPSLKPRSHVSQETLPWVKWWTRHDGSDTSCPCIEPSDQEDEQPSEHELYLGMGSFIVSSRAYLHLLAFKLKIMRAECRNPSCYTDRCRKKGIGVLFNTVFFPKVPFPPSQQQTYCSLTSGQRREDFLPEKKIKSMPDQRPSSLRRTSLLTYCRKK